MQAFVLIVALATEELIGPFDSPADAALYADAHYPDVSWHVAPMAAPTAGA